MKQIFIIVISLIVGFFVGFYAEYRYSQRTIDDILEVSHEACQAQLKTMRFACKNGGIK